MLGKKISKIKIPTDAYFWTAIFFTILSPMVIVNNFLYYNSYDFIWFCDVVVILFAVGFFVKNSQFIKGLINIGLITQFIFIVEFIIAIFFNISLSNTITKILTNNISSISISVATHLFSTNLAIFMTYGVKSKRSSLAYSFVVLVVLYFLTLTLTPPIENINYVFSSDFLFGIKIPFYIYLWPFIAFLFVVTPTYWFQNFVHRQLKSEN